MKLCLLLLAACLGGCYSTPYSAVIEQRIIRLHERTNEVVQAAQAHRLTRAASHEYTRDALESVRIVRNFALSYDEKSSAVPKLDSIEKDLLALHARKAPLRATDLNNTVVTLGELGGAAGYQRETGSSSSNTSSTTDDNYDPREKNKKEREKEKEKERRDKDRRDHADREKRDDDKRDDDKKERDDDRRR